MPFIDLAGNALRVERVVGTQAAPTSIATAGAATYTAAQVLSGIIVRDCAGAGRTDTFPTADLLVAAIPGVQVGDRISVKIVNGSDAAEAITLAEGTSGTWDANQTNASKTIPQNTSKEVILRITNVQTPAYVIYA